MRPGEIHFLKLMERRPYISTYFYSFAKYPNIIIGSMDGLHDTRKKIENQEVLPPTGYAYALRGHRAEPHTATLFP